MFIIAAEAREWILTWNVMTSLNIVFHWVLEAMNSVSSYKYTRKVKATSKIQIIDQRELYFN